MIEVKDFFDNDTATFTYVISDRNSGEAAIIDPLLNYDPASGHATTVGADEVISYISEQKFKLRWLLETHIHADHLSASLYIKKRLGGQLAIGSSIKDVLQHWVPFFNTAHDTKGDASQFDRLLDEGDEILLGEHTIRVLHTPGHTPACASYVIDDNVFVGDALFLPDVGTGRADFPGGSASTLYESLQKILALPEHTKIFSCHDYPPPDRTRTGMSTVGAQRKQNILIKAGTSKDDFVAARNKRDTGKPVPKLLYPSIQVNLRGGSFGESESNGGRFVKIPVDFCD